MKFVLAVVILSVLYTAQGKTVECAGAAKRCKQYIAPLARSAGGTTKGFIKAIRITPLDDICRMQDKVKSATTPQYPHPLIPAHCVLRPQDCPIICTCHPSTLHPTPPDRAKRDTGLRSQVARLIFKQTNETINKLYCVNKDCQNNAGGNYSYSVPVSPMFPRLYLTLQYIILNENSGLQISLCKQNREMPCPTDTESDFSATKLDLLEWDIPVGIFIRSSYKFRIGTSSDGLCEKPDSEVGETFVEYNLEFYRVCA